MTENDIKFMRLAISEAKKALSRQEVPVGAVLTENNKLISKGYNRIETELNSCAHAEMITITKASRKLKSWRRLSGCTIYVTLEPCIMCLGAIINSRIGKVVYGASDPKCASSNLINSNTITSTSKLEVVQSNIEIQTVCSELLTDFFKNLRLGNAI